MDSSWCWGKEADFSPPLPCFMPWLRVPVLAQRLSPVARQEFLIIIAFLSGDSIASLLTCIRPAMKHRTGSTHASLLLSAKSGDEEVALHFLPWVRQFLFTAVRFLHEASKHRFLYVNSSQCLEKSI